MRTRLWCRGALTAENFPLDYVSAHLAEAGALVWVDLCVYRGTLDGAFLDIDGTGCLGPVAGIPEQVVDRGGAGHLVALALEEIRSTGVLGGREERRGHDHLRVGSRRELAGPVDRAQR